VTFQRGNRASDLAFPRLKSGNFSRVIVIKFRFFALIFFYAVAIALATILLDPRGLSAKIRSNCGPARRQKLRNINAQERNVDTAHSDQIIEIVGEPTTYKFETHNLRAYRRGETLWFVANDVCNILDIKNSRQFIEQLDPDEKGVSKIYTPGGVQEVNAISESGLYLAAIRSHKPVGREFSRWVTKTLLPEIRRTGSYSPPGETKQIPQDDTQDKAGQKGLDQIERRIKGLARGTAELEAIVKEIGDSVVLRQWRVPVLLPDFGRYLVVADLGGVKIKGSLTKSFWIHDDLMMVSGLCESVDVIERLWHQTAAFVDREHPQRVTMERLSGQIDHAVATARRMKDIYQDEIKTSAPFNPYFPSSAN
jgi:prophage antirepressor-like protein